MLQIRTGTFALEGLGGPIQWPALQRLRLQPTQGDPIDFLQVFAPAQLLDLQLELLYPLSLAAYLELEGFIIGDMPKLRRFLLVTFLYIDSEFTQPVEESTTQSSSAKQSESLRRIDCTTGASENSVLPFERLIESAPHLEECHLNTNMTSFPSFGHRIRELKLDLYESPISHLMNGEMFKFVHLEVLWLTFATTEQLQLLTLFQAPSLLSLRVLYDQRNHPQDHSISFDIISTFISTSQEIRDLFLCFPVNRMDLSLFELQSLKLEYVSHFSVLENLNVPKLQHLFLEIKEGIYEDGSIVGGQDLVENSIDIVSFPTSFQVVGTPGVPGMVKTTPVLESENERGTMEILDEDVLDGFKGTDLRKAPFDPLMTSPPAFSAITFEHLKDFEFEVSIASNSSARRVLPYFPDMLATLPALERITLPAVSFNDTPYVDQLVKKISEIPTLCRNLQEIRTWDYPDDWSYFLTFLRNRKRASILSDPTLQPIHTLHFPITPHGSIVEQLQDAMLGKVATESFAVPRPRPLLTNPSFVHGVLSWQADLKGGTGEETRPRDQGEDERPAAEPFQAQEADTQGNGDKERQPEAEEGSGSRENEDEVLSCFLCHKAGLGTGCRRVFWKGEILSRIEVSSGHVQCPRWDIRVDRFGAICLP